MRNLLRSLALIFGLAFFLVSCASTESDSVNSKMSGVATDSANDVRNKKTIYQETTREHRFRRD